MFLAKHNVIRENIRDTLQKISGYEELLCDVLNTSLNMYEDRVYLLPDEKHLLVKVGYFPVSVYIFTLLKINISAAFIFIHLFPFTDIKSKNLVIININNSRHLDYLKTFIMIWASLLQENWML